jgi:hypothetical protein
MSDKSKEAQSAQRRKQLLQEWGSLPSTKEVLNLLRRRYPVPKAWHLAPTWEAQHQTAGQQQVLADLTALVERGEM